MDSRTSSESASGPASPSAGIVGVFTALLLAVALVPVFSFDLLPLGDMPNHLARAFILNNIASDPDLQRYYAIDWRLFSFQSTDFILPLLTKALGLVVCRDCGTRADPARQAAGLMGPVRPGLARPGTARSDPSNEAVRDESGTGRSPACAVWDLASDTRRGWCRHRG